MTRQELRSYSPLTLAFLGDGVYELYIRKQLVTEANRPVERLHNEKIKRVCCQYQAKLMDKILPLLTDEETAVFKRGRNSSLSPPKNATVGEYAKATGLETLIGYLYLLEDFERIEELISA